MLRQRERTVQKSSAPTFQKAFVQRATRLFGCYLCDERDSACLSFYIVNAYGSTCAIRVRDCKTLEEVKRELRMGKVLCRNCHKRLTVPLSYSWLQTYKSHRGCQECYIRNPRVLELHHETNKKKFHISQQRLSVPKDVLLHELRKTVVLCANCHSKHHSAF